MVAITPPYLFADVVAYRQREESKPLLAASYPLQDLRAVQQAFIGQKQVQAAIVNVLLVAWVQAAA